MVIKYLTKLVTELQDIDYTHYLISFLKLNHDRSSSWNLAKALSYLFYDGPLLKSVASRFNDMSITKDRADCIKDLVQTGCNESLPTIIDLVNRLYTSKETTYDGGIWQFDDFYCFGLSTNTGLVKKILENDTEREVLKIFTSLDKISHLDTLRHHAGKDKEPKQFTQELLLDSGALHDGIGTEGLDYILSTMATIGEKITELTPSRGFSAPFGAATVVLICSKMGLPISTTHTLVGSVIGVGLARGLATLNFDIIKMIAISWISTIPFTAIISMLCYKIFLVFLP